MKGHSNASLLTSCKRKHLQTVTVLRYPIYWYETLKNQSSPGRIIEMVVYYLCILWRRCRLETNISSWVDKWLTKWKIYISTQWVRYIYPYINLHITIITIRLWCFIIISKENIKLLNEQRVSKMSVCVKTLWWKPLFRFCF